MASRTTRSIQWMLLASGAAGMLGCAPATPRWDREFGSAVRTNLAVQVIDPAASANTNPATGIDGRAARSAHDQYQRAYSRPESEPARSLVGAFGK